MLKDEIIRHLRRVRDRVVRDTNLQEERITHNKEDLEDLGESYAELINHDTEVAQEILARLRAESEALNIAIEVVQNTRSDVLKEGA